MLSCIWIAPSDSSAATAGPIRCSGAAVVCNSTRATPSFRYIRENRPAFNSVCRRKVTVPKLARAHQGSHVNTMQYLDPNRPPN
jgi:hypothetical protein